jgi:hypothetical protein
LHRLVFLELGFEFLTILDGCREFYCQGGMVGIYVFGFPAIDFDLFRGRPWLRIPEFDRQILRKAAELEETELGLYR